MPATLQAFLIIFLVSAFLRSSGVLTKSHAEQLTTLVFSLSLPATILVSLNQITFDAAAWKMPFAACLVTLGVLASSWFLGRLLHLPLTTQGSFLVGTGCINSVYFAYPVTLATFGEEGLIQAVLFDLGQTSLTLTLIYGIALRHGRSSPTARLPVARFLSAPPLWALCIILGLKAIGLGLPSWLQFVLTPIHLTTAPLASVVLGLSISLPAMRAQFPLAMLGVIVRMGGGLLFGLTAVFLLELTGVQRATLLLIAAMPSAVSAVIYATETDLDQDLVASIVAISICIGFAFLPFLPRLTVLLSG
ncbi:MAG TPA: AEC family transporter [Nitrospiraceae bacterium]|nr:AEC family transporter [Nitrospiraceae bacterium]